MFVQRKLEREYVEPLSLTGKCAAVVLAMLTAVCTFFALGYVCDEIWGQWSTPNWRSIWVAGRHTPVPLVMLALVLVNFVALLIVGVWLLRNVKNPFFPRRIFAGWFVVILVSEIAFLPSHAQYAAVAVLLLGPAQN